MFYWFGVVGNCTLGAQLVGSICTGSSHKCSVCSTGLDVVGLCTLQVDLQVQGLFIFQYASTGLV